MRRPPMLVTDTVSTNTVDCAQDLLRMAQAGELRGLAFCAILRGNNYIVNTAGEAHRNPTFTRGMVAALDDSLSHRIHNREDGS